MQKINARVGGGFSAEIMRGCYQKIVDRSVSIGINCRSSRSRRLYTSSYLDGYMLITVTHPCGLDDMGLMYFQATKTAGSTSKLRIKSAC